MQEKANLKHFPLSAETVQWLKHSDSAMGQFHISCALTELSLIASNTPCPLRVGCGIQCFWSRSPRMFFICGVIWKMIRVYKQAMVIFERIRPVLLLLSSTGNYTNVAKTAFDGLSHSFFSLFLSTYSTKLHLVLDFSSLTPSADSN